MAMRDDPSDKVSTGEPPRPARDIHLPSHGVSVNHTKALIAGAVLWIGWLAMVWAVTSGRTGAIDERGLLFARTPDTLGLIGGDGILEAVRDITALGGVFLTTVFAAAAVVALLFLRLKREAVLYAATVFFGWMLNNAMKALVGRERPELVPHLAIADGNSFPSGHSFASAMVYIAMALAFASMSNRHSVRYTIVGSAMGLSGAIAWSRVILGVHYPSDVIAGWLGGAAWAFTAAALLYRPARAVADSDVAERLGPAEQ